MPVKPRPRKHRHITLPAPEWSARLYVKLVQKDARTFRYLLEAEDNLAYTSVTDRKACIFKVTFSPHQEKEVHDYLRAMQKTLPFEIIEAPLEHFRAFKSCNALKEQYFHG